MRYANGKFNYGLSNNLKTDFSETQILKIITKVCQFRNGFHF